MRYQIKLACWQMFVIANLVMAGIGGTIAATAVTLAAIGADTSPALYDAAVCGLAFCAWFACAIKHLDNYDR